MFIAYGVTLETDLDLSAYLCRAETGRYQLQISGFQGADIEYSNRVPLFASHGREVVLLTDRLPEGNCPGQSWAFEVGDVVRFYWEGASPVIRYQRLVQCTDSLLAFWLIHIFLPLFLTLEERYEFMHACAVRVGQKTILFTAPSHGGKSTLTDYFLKRGHGLVSDDKVATLLQGDRYLAVPSHPNHRPYRSFEDLGNRVDDFDVQPSAIDAIYVLQRMSADGEVCIEEISGHAKFSQMLPSYLFGFHFMKGKRLKYLGELLNALPMYRVDVPWDLERLGEVHNAICEHQVQN